MTITSHGLRSISHPCPVIDIPFEDDLGSVLKVSIHLPIAVHPDHTGKLGAAGEREVECRTGGFATFPLTPDPAIRMNMHLANLMTLGTHTAFIGSLLILAKVGEW